jgi:hypothetical protein
LLDAHRPALIWSKAARCAACHGKVIGMLSVKVSSAEAALAGARVTVRLADVSSDATRQRAGAGMPSVLVGLLLLLSTSTACVAWGEAGHATVAEIAGRHLSKKARAHVRKLLGPGAHEMAAVASWADDVRDNGRPETYNWHVVEIPPDAAGYDRARDCRNDDCIVEKIKEFARVVADRRVARAERSEALKFLIHFVGDLHMPLHAYAPLNHPKGTWVRIGALTDKLHLWWDWGWWDRAFEDEFGTEPLRVAETMAAQITPEEQQAWMAGTPEDWANESFKLASEFVAAHGLLAAVREDNHSEKTPIVLARSVLDNEIGPVVIQRLKMAGVRLAWQLNEAFK